MKKIDLSPIIHARFSINVLENADGELLLLHRAPHLRLAPGQWGFPAGHREPDESPEQCAQRELREEIGQNHEITLVQKLGPIRDTLYGGIYEIHLFHQRWHSGTITLNHEHTAFAWVSRDRFKEYDVMNGIDEDILYLGIWPREFLREEKLRRE